MRACLRRKSRRAHVHHFLQAADQRIEQRIERGGGGKRAAKIEQAVAHVVTLAVKQPVDSFLEKVLHRRGNHHDRCHGHDRHDHAQGDLAGSRTLVAAKRVETGQVNHRADHQGNRERRQRVNKDATDDQLDVHQAVANNRIAKRQRNQNQRQDGSIGQPGISLGAQQITDAIQKREGRDRQQRPQTTHFICCRTTALFALIQVLTSKTDARDQTPRQSGQSSACKRTPTKDSERPGMSAQRRNQSESTHRAGKRKLPSTSRQQRRYIEQCRAPTSCSERAVAARG